MALEFVTLPPPRGQSPTLTLYGEGSEGSADTEIINNTPQIEAQHRFFTLDDAVLQVAEYAGKLPFWFVETRRALRRDPNDECSRLVESRIYSGENLLYLLRELKGEQDYANVDDKPTKRTANARRAAGKEMIRAARHFIETGEYVYEGDMDEMVETGEHKSRASGSREEHGNRRRQGAEKDNTTPTPSRAQPNSTLEPLSPARLQKHKRKHTAASAEQPPLIANNSPVEAGPDQANQKLTNLKLKLKLKRAYTKAQEEASQPSRAMLRLLAPKPTETSGKGLARNRAAVPTTAQKPAPYAARKRLPSVPSTHVPTSAPKASSSSLTSLGTEHPDSISQQKRVRTASSRGSSSLVAALKVPSSFLSSLGPTVPVPSGRASKQKKVSFTFTVADIQEYEVPNSSRRTSKSKLQPLTDSKNTKSSSKAPVPKMPSLRRAPKRKAQAASKSTSGSGSGSGSNSGSGSQVTLLNAPSSLGSNAPTPPGPASKRRKVQGRYNNNNNSTSTSTSTSSGSRSNPSSISRVVQASPSLGPRLTSTQPGAVVREIKRERSSIDWAISYPDQEVGWREPRPMRDNVNDPKDTIGLRAKLYSKEDAIRAMEVWTEKYEKESMREKRKREEEEEEEEEEMESEGSMRVLRRKRAVVRKKKY